MKLFCTILFTLVLVLGLGAIAEAKAAKCAKKKTATHAITGTIASVSVNAKKAAVGSIAVGNKAKNARGHAIKVNARTKIKLDGTAAKLSDLKAGQTVTIKVSRSVAKVIKARR